MSVSGKIFTFGEMFMLDLDGKVFGDVSTLARKMLIEWIQQVSAFL